MIVKNTDLGSEGHDPSSIFKGPEAFRTLLTHCHSSERAVSQKSRKAKRVPG